MTKKREGDAPNDHTPSAPAANGATEADVAMKARALRVEGFLAKPMSFEELLHVVQNRAITVVTGQPLAASCR